MSSDNVKGADNQQESKSHRRISSEYLAGFTDGEGCFYIGFSKRNDLPLKWQIITEFHLSQNPGGRNILREFCKRIGCGYIKLNHPGSSRDKSLVLIVKNKNDLREKLIPFFKKHPLYSGKARDFEIFERVLFFMKDKQHL
ncbi:LAGLIDADG family homing endonuclease, partial [Candidatus Microgenomates bacterium]|nr:LAGLIDADG family homing endonuclease [Candidatus Microgenomates bacterium]